MERTFTKPTRLDPSDIRCRKGCALALTAAGPTGCSLGRVPGPALVLECWPEGKAVMDTGGVRWCSGWTLAGRLCMLSALLRRWFPPSFSSSRFGCLCSPGPRGSPRAWLGAPSPPCSTAGTCTLSLCSLQSVHCLTAAKGAIFKKKEKRK